jgi:hypothetical protein
VSDKFGLSATPLRSIVRQAPLDLRPLAPKAALTHHPTSPDIAEAVSTRPGDSTLATSEQSFGPSYCAAVPKSRDYDVRVRDHPTVVL